MRNGATGDRSGEENTLRHQQPQEIQYAGCRLCGMRV